MFSTLVVQDYCYFFLPKGGAVITNPPTDQTVLEHSEVAFKCEAVANPRNISVTWFKGNSPLKSIDEGGLSERSTFRSGNLSKLK